MQPGESRFLRMLVTYARTIRRGRDLDLVEAAAKWERLLVEAAEQAERTESPGETEGLPTSPQGAS